LLKLYEKPRVGPTRSAGVTTMDPAALFSSANLLYIHQEYEEALKHYTCAVSLEDSADYRVCRAACFIKLGKFAKALEDAEQAMKFDPKSHMAHYWKGIASFYIGEFNTAKLAFEESVKIAPNAKTPRTHWVRKCDPELSGSTLPLQGLAGDVVNAVPRATGSSDSGAPSQASAPSKPTSASAKSEATSSAKKEGLSISGRKPIRREWYQNNSHVIITIFAKDIPEDVCKVNFHEQDLAVSFPLPGAPDEEYKLELELFEPIEPSGCRIEISKVKIELHLAKKSSGTHWKALEKQAEVLSVTSDQPSYPTSSKQKRDWGQINREMDQELKNDKSQGDEALNKLFREIYDRADDDTRRAMNKSFQTSGGTVLSTNWGEVAKSDYEGKDRPTPPEGQEWKDWRQK